MPRKARSTKPKAKANRKRRGVRRNYRKNVREYASLSCTSSLLALSSGTMYFNPNINLAAWPRAASVAQNYQRFRIRSVKLVIKPNQDAFTSVAAGSPQKPYVYFMIDKTGSIPNNITLEALKQMGAKPYALDEKPFKFEFQPAVHTVTQESGALTSPFSQHKISPWLTTNDNPNTAGAWVANTTLHYGYKMFIEQVGALTLFNAELEVQFEFIKPLLPALSQVSATQQQLAVLDASPDGVEGGSDGITIPIMAHT